MSALPFTQTQKGGLLIREFSKDVNSSELAWHRDREDREVYVKSGQGWLLQLENKVPKVMTPGETYFIPRRTYHRIIKGTTNLVVEISELKREEALLREFIRSVDTSPNSHLRDPNYIRVVLDIDIPLNESYPFSPDLQKRIIEEQLVLEGFFSDLKKLGGDSKNAGLAMRYIMQDSSRLSDYIDLVNQEVKDFYEKCKDFLETLVNALKELPEGVGEVVEKVVNWATKVLEKIKSGVEGVKTSGWKGAMVISGVLVGIGYLWKELEPLKDPAAEAIKKLKSAVSAAGKAVKKLGKKTESIDLQVPLLTEALFSSDEDFQILVEAGEGEESGEESTTEKVKSAAKELRDLFMEKIKEWGPGLLKKLAFDQLAGMLTGGIGTAFNALKTAYGGAKLVFKFLGGPLGKFVDGIKNPKKEAEEAEKGVDDPTDANFKEKNEALIRSAVRELLAESVEFHELDSPLQYNRSGNVKRLAYCDTSVTEPPSQRDAYFKEYQEMNFRGRSGRRLKKPRPGKIIPGVSNVCIIGFLDYHDYGKTSDGKQMWYIDYMKTRGDSQGQGVASKLLDEFFERYAEPGGMVHFGKMMRKEIGHLKDKMAEKYPDIDVIGAKNF